MGVGELHLCYNMDLLRPQLAKAPETSAPSPPSVTPQALLPASITILAVPSPSPEAAPVSTAPAGSLTDVYGQAASNLVAGSNLDSTIQEILDMGGGTWDRDTVVRALRATFNNPERAVDYLYSGIPEQAEVPAVAPVSGTEWFIFYATGPTQLLGAGAADATPAGNLDFLRNSQQFQALRALVQANPQILQPMLQELGKQNPQLVRMIQEHQGDFLRLLNEPAEGGDAEGNILRQLAGAMPQTVQVTPEESEALGRLEALGFDRALVLEVFFACNRNEELAANYLLDHMHDGGEPASVGVCRLSRRGRRVSVFGLCGDAAATTYDGTVVIACGDFGGLECVGRDERDRRHGMAIVRARNDDCVD
ncbi:hypothetical protein ACFE04_003116 [Oxalis oulophora]